MLKIKIFTHFTIRMMAAVQGPEISTICSTNSINSTPGATQEIFSCSEGHLNVVYEEVQDTSKILDMTGKSEYLVTTCPAYGCHSKGYKEIHIKKDQLSIKRIRLIIIYKEFDDFWNI